MSTALEYLHYTPGEATTVVAVMKDRIFQSGAATQQEITQQFSPPPFPFVQEHIQVRPVLELTTCRRTCTGVSGMHGFGIVSALFHMSSNTQRVDN